MPRNRFATNVHKYVSLFPHLKYDGSAVFCLICNVRLAALDRTDCQRHVNGIKHMRNARTEIPYTLFLIHLLIMFTSCNLPLSLVRKAAFKTFWRQYVPKYPLPSQTQLQNHLPRMKEMLENVCKRDLCSKKIWITVDETTDIKKNSIVNVIARVLSSENTASRYLLACKRVQQCTAENIQKVIMNALKKFKIAQDQVVMIVTDSAATMLSVGRSLKHIFPNLIHITCVLHALHLVGEVVRQHYGNVDRMIGSTKAVFRKSPKRLKEFRKFCPGIPEPPEPILTRWGTWLTAASYYLIHFQQIQSVIMRFNRNESKAIRESQREFQIPQLLEDLTTICTNYTVLLDAIRKLQCTELSLQESLDIVESVKNKLHTLNDTPGLCASQKLADVLRKNPDFNTLEAVYNKCKNSELLSDFEKQFLHANVTSLDVERSFSMYKNIFSCRRTRFKEVTVETYAMMQVYSSSHPDASNLLNN